MPENPTCRALLRALSIRPGASPALLGQLVGKGHGAVEHAIHALVKEGKVHILDSCGGKACYLDGSGAGAAFALRGAPLRFLEALHRRGAATAREMAAETGLDPAEVSRAASRLQQAGMVEAIQLGRELHYLPSRPKA